MIFQVIEFKEPDRSTPDGQIEFIYLKLSRLRFENDPAYQCEHCGPPMPLDEQIKLLEEMMKDAQKVRSFMWSKQRREQQIEKQLAAGGLPWLAIKHIMLERGFTHVRMQTCNTPLATFEPYGNGIHKYYHAILLPERGPGWFMDCAPEHDPNSPLYLGVFECIKLEYDNDPTTQPTPDSTAS